MAKLFETSSFIAKDGITSGAVRNCYVRLNSAAEAPALEIFSPKIADEDRSKIRDILDEPYSSARREWIDSGLRIFLEGIPPRALPQKAEPLIEKITAHFGSAYPLDVFRHYKHYSCGGLSRVILLHINQTIVLKYCEELRADFTKNYMKVIVNEADRVEKVYINTYEMGTLEYKNGLLETRRWENEDEAQAGNYLNRRYTQRLLNGVVNEPDHKTGMIGIIRSSMSGAAIDPEDSRVFTRALAFLETGAAEQPE